MQANTLQAKQQYLREKIIDAGHDAQKFVEFCAQKHNLDDLENWSLHELIEIVQTFLNFVNPHQYQKTQIKNQSEEKQQILKQQPLNIVANPVNDPNKLGLVFSQDDWSVLLSGPSILGVDAKPKKQDDNTLNALMGLDFNHKPIKSEVESHPQLTLKQFPLSPPSIESKTKAPEPQKSDGLSKSAIQQIKIQKKLQKRQSADTGVPINISNIILTTAKQKTLTPLPNISEVSVIKTQQVTRNFLQGDYTLYHINFSPCQIVIQRRFADLLKLRGILQRMFPFLRLPYLEPEGWLTSSEGKDPETLAKYKQMVEEFIRYIIIKSDQFKNCEVVRFFCGLTKKQFTKDQFRKKLEAYDNIPRPKFLGEVILTNNSLLISPTKPGDKYNLGTLTLINQIDVQYERLRRQLDLLFTNIDLVLKSYNDISGTFQTIQNLIKRFNIDTQTSKDFGSFQGLRQMTLRLTRKTINQCDIFRNRIKNIFKYEKENMTTLKQIIDFSNNIHYEFAKQGFPSLPTNKLKGANMEVESPVPLEDPSKNSKLTLAIQEIFWSWAIRREGQRYWQLLRKKINENLTLIAYDELDSENQNLNFWNFMIKRCVV